MNRRVFVIGDTHFGHKNIINYEPSRGHFKSIQEHDEELVARWNNIVAKEDIVWHLGDVAFGEKNLELVSQLNGCKRLILGNHDNYPIEKYLRHFKSVHAMAIVNKCILTHIPVHYTQFGRFKLNIHGHLHSNELPDKRYVCASAEHQNLAPKLLDSMIHQALKGI